jgi:hypothetical protein
VKRQEGVAPRLAARVNIGEQQCKRTHNEYGEGRAYGIVAEMLEEVQSHEKYEKQAEGF